MSIVRHTRAISCRRRLRVPNEALFSARIWSSQGVPALVQAQPFACFSPRHLLGCCRWICATIKRLRGGVDGLSSIHQDFHRPTLYTITSMALWARKLVDQNNIQLVSCLLRFLSSPSLPYTVVLVHLSYQSFFDRAVAHCILSVVLSDPFHSLSKAPVGFGSSSHPSPPKPELPP